MVRSPKRAVELEELAVCTCAPAWLVVEQAAQHGDLAKEEAALAHRFQNTPGRPGAKATSSRSLASEAEGKALAHQKTRSKTKYLNRNSAFIKRMCKMCCG